MNLLQVLLNPEREERQAGERAIVCEAANMLQVGEFQVLALAARHWFGRDLPEPALGRLFSQYLMCGEVPPWARHFARAVLARAERGEIGETEAATGGAVAPTAAEVRRFWLAAGLLALTLAAGVLAAAGTVRHPISRMPPYFERDEVPTGEGTATTTPDVR